MFLVFLFFFFFRIVNNSITINLQTLQFICFVLVLALALVVVNALLLQNY